MIGREGKNISKIRTETGTRIQFERDELNIESTHCLISGPRETCYAAVEKIKDIVGTKLGEQIKPVAIKIK